MVASNVQIPQGLYGESVLVRRPAIPLWWDEVNRPHVALVFVDSSSRPLVRFYLSERGNHSSQGKRPLNVPNLDIFPEGTILEVRFSSVMVNLFRLELIDGVACWRWIGRCRGMHDFDLEQVNWLAVLSPDDYSFGSVPN